MVDRFVTELSPNGTPPMRPTHRVVLATCVIVALVCPGVSDLLLCRSRHGKRFGIR